MALDAASRFGDAVAVVDGGRRISFTELVADARRVTAALLANGLEPGERAAIWSPNRYEWLVAALGILGAGGAVVPVNTRFKGEEVRYILDRSGARVVFTVGEFLGVDYAATIAGLRSQLPNLATVVGFDEGSASDQSLTEFQATGDAIDHATVDARIGAVGGDDVSDVLFTSGTTGAPKGVLMTHAQTLRQFSDWCDMAGLVEGDRYLIVNPFFHMFGYKAGCLASLMRGATIIPKPVFEVDDLLRTVAEESVAVFPGPPTVYQSILDHPDRDAYDLSTLRLAVTGAADIPVELIRRMHDELPFSLIVTGYGLTEAGTVTATAPDDDFETIATTVGRVRPGLEIRVAAEDGGDLPAGEAGELLVRGYSVMRGYLDDPDATAATIDADGWLHTGDLATIDARGCVRIVGRIKDMFIVGGFNAYPAEIENLLLGHPAVAQGGSGGHARRPDGRGGHGLRGARPGRVARARRAHRVVARHDGQLQGAARGRAHRRAPGERGGQGREGDAAGAGRSATGRGTDDVVMDTRYSDEQLELQRSAASLVADLGPKTVDDLDDASRRDRLADAARRSGWYELRGPGDGDQPLASAVEVAIIARELGRRAADTPYLGPVVAVDLARCAGLEVEDAATSAVFDRSLLDFAIAPAVSEGVAVDCAGSVRGLALVGGDGDGTAHLVEVALPEPAPETDLTRAVAPVSLADVAPDGDGAVVGEDAIARSRALALTITVADLLGAMEGVLDTTADYAKERQQYGVPIGSFQAVQHLLAEARVLVEGSISVAQYAAWAVDALPATDALDAGSVAKAYTARAARTVCETAIQVHGGIGNTWECFVHVYLRRALLSSALLGDEGHHLRELAQRRLGVGTEVLSGLR